MLQERLRGVIEHVDELFEIVNVTRKVERCDRTC
jgi:hypothetical protein